MQHPPVALFVGLAAWDTIALVSQFPAADGRAVADAIVEAGGGPAATAAVACARLGVPSAYIGTVGDDARGNRILAALTAEGVDVANVVTRPGIASTAAVIVVDRTHGTRALCPTLPPPLELGAPQQDAIAAARIVHVDQVGYDPVTALLKGHGIKVPVSVDAGNPIPGLDPSAITLFAPTLGQLRNLVGEGTPQSILRRVRALDWTVATDGAAGAYAMQGDAIWHAPSYAAADCISTLGAGDVFHGALVAAWSHGFDAPTATAYAAIAAGLSCGGIDGRSAIPSHATVMRALATHHAVPLESMES